MSLSKNLGVSIGLIDMPGPPKAEEAMTYLHYTVCIGMVWIFRVHVSIKFTDDLSRHHGEL